MILKILMTVQNERYFFPLNRQRHGYPREMKQGYPLPGEGLSHHRDSRRG
jgi:hypothetical protein